MSINTNLFTDTSLTVLKKALDASTMRNETISNNIANVNTKDYKAKRVVFEDELKKALSSGSEKGLATTHKGHIGASNEVNRIQPQIVEDAASTVKSDGNNVDIDVEMVELAKNQLIYNTLVQQTSKKYSNLGYVINGG
ncbi:MAG: flagellar basal body rod protein FlgB [Clostridiales bacterium]|nr:flagellar basal body rod protein FlgB [Clostridiales bacterium]